MGAAFARDTRMCFAMCNPTLTVKTWHRTVPARPFWTSPIWSTPRVFSNFVSSQVEHKTVNGKSCFFPSLPSSLNSTFAHSGAQIEDIESAIMFRSKRFRCNVRTILDIVCGYCPRASRLEDYHICEQIEKGQRV